MSGHHGVLSSDYPCRKDAPEDKDPPEENGPCLSKVIPSSLRPIASCNADVSSVLKQAKRSLLKNTKLTPAQKHEIYKFSTFANTL